MSVENPLNKQVNALRQKVSKFEQKKQKIGTEIRWYSEFCFEDVSAEVAEAEQLISQLKVEIQNTQEDISILRDELNAESKSLVSIFRPVSYFSHEQKTRRKQIARVKKGLELLQTRLTNEVAQEAKLKLSIANYSNDIKRHGEFDISYWSRLYEVTAKALSDTEAKLKDQESAATELQNIINVAKKEVDANQLEVQAINSEIEKLKQLEDGLTHAKNSYERKLIHKKCEALYGVGQPTRALKHRERRKDSLERTIIKLNERLSQQIERKCRIIDHIIFDGNNFCYCGERFIGLNALIVAINKLQNYPRVSVIFDAGIRGLCRADNQSITSKFPDWVEIHIVATKQKADETILGLARDNQLSFIVTNDRFSEFNSENAVKEKRMIRHEILSDKVFIHDLSVDVSY